MKNSVKNLEKYEKLEENIQEKTAKNLKNQGMKLEKNILEFKKSRYEKIKWNEKIEIENQLKLSRNRKSAKIF